MRYATEGPVRDGCGHAHRTEGAAARCIRKDARAVKRGYGRNAYSDRIVKPLTGRQR